MYHFFAYMFRMRYIQRWGLMRNTSPENVQEHSHQVALIAHSLALINNTVFHGSAQADRVLALAVYHEAGEVITGDLPTPIKYHNTEIRDAYKALEGAAEDSLLGMLPEELRTIYQPWLHQASSEEHALMKAADKLCAYFKCVEEVKSGNREFEKARVSILREVEAMPLQEVSYFMEHFAPSFELTLDELN